MDREAQLTLRKVVSKDQWVEDILRDKPGKTTNTDDGRSMVLGPEVILLEDPSSVCVAGLDLLKKQQRSTRLLMNSLKLRAFQQVSLALV